MQKQIAIGVQDFSKIIESNYYYIDKTYFIKEWWEKGDEVTLITRPRRFGKTLTMSMVEYFFSINKQNDYFDNLCISEDQNFMQLQNSYPVINLSFAKVKETTFEKAKERIYTILLRMYKRFGRILECGDLSKEYRDSLYDINMNMSEVTATDVLNYLSEMLFQHYGKKVIILLDEYDTPMQEAYANGYWNEMSSFMRSFFNSTFKTNDCLERALLTGITHVSKESLFSDFNNSKIITTSSNDYANVFGFTESEVLHALDTYGLSLIFYVKRK